MRTDTKRHAVLWAVDTADGPVTADDVERRLAALPDGVATPVNRSAIESHFGHLEDAGMIGRISRGTYTALESGRRFIDEHGPPKGVGDGRTADTVSTVRPNTKAYAVLYAAAVVGEGTNRDIYEAVGRAGPADQKNVAATTGKLVDKGLLASEPTPPDADTNYQYVYRPTEAGRALVEEYGPPEGYWQDRRDAEDQLSDLDHLFGDGDEDEDDDEQTGITGMGWPAKWTDTNDTATEPIIAPSSWNVDDMAADHRGHTHDDDGDASFLGDDEFGPFINVLQDVDERGYDLVEGDVRVRGKSVYVTVHAQRRDA